MRHRFQAAVMEGLVVKLDLALAKKFLEANNLYGEQQKRLDTITWMEAALERERKGDKGQPQAQWTLWVYLKFDPPNETLGLLSRLHRRFPRLAELLAVVADAEGLLGVHLFMVRQEGTSITVTDFVRV